MTEIPRITSPLARFRRNRIPSPVLQFHILPRDRIAAGVRTERTPELGHPRLMNKVPDDGLTGLVQAFNANVAAQNLEQLVGRLLAWLLHGIGPLHEAGVMRNPSLES